MTTITKTKIDTKQLEWKVFTTPSIPFVPNSQLQLEIWQPISSTLIYGEQDAVLVDTFITIEQADALVNWVEASGKNLTTIYITHGHGDHFFGLGALLKRFPNAKAVATSNVIKLMQEQIAPTLLNLLSTGFPNQIPEQLVIANVLEGNVIDLEGHALIVIEVGHTDSDHSTCLYVPSIGLLVAGDAVYNDDHLYLVGSTKQMRGAWISALNTLESLNPQAVVAGHKKIGNDDDPKIIRETRQYIRDFDRLVETTTTAQELYDHMLKLYPNRVNPGMLWSSASSIKS